MSNTQAQFGFQHIGYMPGYAPDMAPTRRMIQSSYATAIFFGDPVCKSTLSPYIKLGSDANANPLGTGAVTACAGVFQGCYYVPKGQTGAPVFTPWFPGSTQTDATALIIDSPGALFRAAAILTAVPATAIGNNIGWTAGPGGTSIGTTFGQGFSSFCVDQSTLTTGTGAFVIVDTWSNRIGSTGNGTDNGNPYNWVVVGFNNNWLKAGQTGVP